jgi:hypothetical protein
MSAVGLGDRHGALTEPDRQIERLRIPLEVLHHLLPTRIPRCVPLKPETRKTRVALVRVQVQTVVVTPPGRTHFGRLFEDRDPVHARSPQTAADSQPRRPGADDQNVSLLRRARHPLLEDGS